MIDATENPRFQEFMKLVDKHRTHGRAHQRRHAEDAKVARAVRRRGHRPVPHRAHVLRQGLRRAAVPAAEDDPQQDESKSGKAAVDELFPFVKESIKGTLEAMDGLPVTIRLLGSAAARVRAAGQGRRRPNWPRP